MRLKEHGHGDPEKQGAVFRRQRLNRQGADVLGFHGGIVALRAAPVGLVPVAPGRVGIEYGVLLHRLNISRTIRSAPFTIPVSTSILKISWPRYCQTMVTAGRELSTAGAALERKAE